MHSSKDDASEPIDTNYETQIHPVNTSPITPESTLTTTSPGSALLVVEDNSNSVESPINHSTESKSMLSTVNPINFHHQAPATIATSSIDHSNDTADQQRRRNSSIAKLLGGQPLNNQQYEEIHQQILDDQSAQNSNHNSENGISRSRSSITRTLLMNAERHDSHGSISQKVAAIDAPTQPPFVKDFEYLIRRELDNEQSAAIIRRNGSNSNVFKNLNLSNQNNGHISNSLKVKRKRSISKISTSIMQNGMTGNIPPFSIHEPFELDSPAPQDSNNIPYVNRQHRDQNELLRFKPSNHSSYQNQSHHGLSNSNLARGSHSFHPYHKMNLNGSFYGQVNIHHTRIRTTENQRSSSFSFPHHPASIRFTLPSPSFNRPTVLMTENKIKHTSAHCSRKTQLILSGSDSLEVPRPRSYSNFSSSSVRDASEICAPLKKRLLTAYKNETETNPS